MSQEVYENLVDALMLVGGAVPIVKCDELIILMKELFTAEEAMIAAAMPLGVNTVEGINRNEHCAEEDVLPLLESMADKALVFHQKHDGKDVYKLMPILPGFFELHLGFVNPCQIN